MMSIIGSILSMLGPVIVWSLNKFIANKERKEKAVKSYYGFLKSIDKKSADKVENYIKAESSLADLQRKIREENLKEPEREAAKFGDMPQYEIPDIEVVDIDVKTKGKYLTKSGRARGLIVHFTAGRFSKGRQNAIDTLNYLARQGLGCLVMDTAGRIYRAKSQEFDEIAWHAGTSYFMGHDGISRYCLGLEICCAGQLDEKGKSWFGQVVNEKFIRHVATKNENQKVGHYHKFTSAQEKSLINFILWQYDTNPEFNLNWVLGHDEVAKERKSDPGGSLSMTMPELRNIIKKRASRLGK